MYSALVGLDFFRGEVRNPENPPVVSANPAWVNVYPIVLISEFLHVRLLQNFDPDKISTKNLSKF